MKLVLLEMSQGLGEAITFLLGTLVILIFVSVIVYLIAYWSKIGNVWSSLLSILITIALSIVILYYRSVTSGARPYKSLMDKELIQTAFEISSTPLVIILIVFTTRYLKEKREKRN